LDLATFHRRHHTRCSVLGFPGVNREFCVADGHGVILNINGVDHRCEPGSITKFRGDDVVFATLIDGPMRALNLMVRDNAEEKHLSDAWEVKPIVIVAINKPQTLNFGEQNSQLEVLDAIFVNGNSISFGSHLDNLVFIV
jgi:environmental stress-induced protein Ves